MFQIHKRVPVRLLFIVSTLDVGPYRLGLRHKNWSRSQKVVSLFITPKHTHTTFTPPPLIILKSVPFVEEGKGCEERGISGMTRLSTQTRYSPLSIPLEGQSLPHDSPTSRL